MKDDREWLGCQCYSPDHYLLISGDDRDPDVPAHYRQFSITTGAQWVPIRMRLREVWNVIRGEPRFYAETLLDVTDATKFRNHIDQWIQDVRAHEQREQAAD